MKFKNPVLTPHLPKNKVGCVLIGERYRDKLDKPLKLHGIEAVWVADNPDVDIRLAGHVDLSVIHLGGRKLVAKNNVNILTNGGFEIISPSAVQKAEYPADAGLNGCILGAYFVHDPSITDKSVMSGLESKTIIDVKQGYAKCSICVLDENSIITSDSGIGKAARLYGIDVLEISPGHIELEGFGYGFIGGSTFKLSDHEIAFTGKINAHPDSEKMLSFISEKGITPVYLTDEPLFDIGSAVPILEY